MTRLVEMPAKKSTKDATDNQDSEGVMTGWLQKIFQKIEAIEEKQNVFHKFVEDKFRTISAEIEKAKMGQCTTQGNNTNNKPSQNTYLNIEKNLHERKHAYYKHIRSHGISTIYKEFLERDIAFIPKKFRESHIPGESERQKERVSKLEKTKVLLECERLDEESEKNEQKLKTIEQEVASQIQAYPCPEKRQEFKELWLTATAKEEKISNEIWEKKKTFFENLPNANTNRKQISEGNGEQTSHYRGHHKNYFGNLIPNKHNRYGNSYGNNTNYTNNRNRSISRNITNYRNRSQDQFFRGRKFQPAWRYYAPESY